jgi:hypothetical protein
VGAGEAAHTLTETAGNGLGSYRVEAVAVDEPLGSGEAEETGALVTGLGFGGDTSDFEEGDSGGELIESVDCLGVLVESGGDSEGSVDVETEEGGVQGGEVGVVAALVERESKVVENAKTAETEDMGGLRTGAGNVIAAEEVAEERRDRVGVN